MSKIFLIIGSTAIIIISIMNPIVNSYNLRLRYNKFKEEIDYFFYNENNSYKKNYFQKYFKINYNLDDINENEKRILYKYLDPIYNKGPQSSPWPMKCHDSHHTSQSPYCTENNPGDDIWWFESNSWIEGGIAIDNNSILYFGDTHHYLYSVYPDGTLNWKYKTGGRITSTPAIANDGTIYIGSWDTGLYALNPEGILIWKVNLGGSIFCSPVIGNNGIIYIGTLSGHQIVAINPNGSIEWTYETGYAITGSPTIDYDGTIYCGSGDTYFYAINPNGTLKWRFKTGDYIKGPSSIDENGFIYFGSYDDYLYSLYPNGTLRWKCKVGSGTETNPSIASDGSIYVGSPDGHLYAVFPNGTLKWSFEVNGYIHQSSPAISSDGTIYVGTNIGDTAGGDIVAISSDGIEKWRKRIAKAWVDSSPSISEDGTVYIGSSYEMARGFLYAFNKIHPDAPSAPDIFGPLNGDIDIIYKYRFNSTSPLNNRIRYLIDWGDGDIDDWSQTFESGQIITKQHVWSKPGSYIIKARCKDINNLWGEWGFLEINIPRYGTKLDDYWSEFIDMFPLLQRILYYTL